MDDYDEDYYRESRGSFEAEDDQIDRMMQSLRNWKYCYIYLETNSADTVH